MKQINHSRQWLLAAVCTAALVLTSCIQENLAACYKLTLKAENAKGDDVTGTALADASLYVFDENYIHLETVRMTEGQIRNREEIRLNYPEDRNLHVVAWGNLSGENQTITESEVIEELKVMLKSRDGLAQKPDDLFYGSHLVQTKAAGGYYENDTIVVRPKLSQVNIITQNIKYALNRNFPTTVNEDINCDYFVNRTLSGFDYQGQLTGDSVYYSPDAGWDENKEYFAPNYRMCSGENLGVELTAEDRTLAIATHDDNGNPLKAPEAGILYVVLRFGEDGALLSVRQTVRPWGTVDDHIEF
ncbi:MAG: FimB/Mfa2 family fimbrial subunit [Parabacteroides gordonii]|nr:FimB/Mfa2 family fimbrial subunit [Parabacteroides gordonii]